MADILSLSAYKSLRGIDAGDMTRDAGLEIAIDAAEDTILRETGRDFTAAETTSTKTYQYNGSGVLAIDDVVTITELTADGSAVGDDAWTLGGPNGPPWCLILFNGPVHGSPQMGFSRNLDTLYNCWWRRESTIAITGTWGWPGAAPASVVMAATYLVDEFAPKHPGDASGLAAESIESYSVVYQSAEADQTGAEVLPPRVAQLLSPFIRPRF